MAALQGVIAATMYGKDVSLHDILYFLKIHEKFHFMDEALQGLLLSQAIAQEGITATNAELQKAMDQFRVTQKLYKAADTIDWLQQHAMTVQDLENRLQYTVAVEKLQDKVTANKIERYFAENKAAFDTAKISHIVVPKEGVASELFSQITEEDAAFVALARQHSIDTTTRENGGYLGVVTRRALSPAVEAAIFSAQAGTVVGPVKTGMGYHVIQVHSLHPSQLNDTTRNVLRNLLFTEWLEAATRQARITITLSEQI